MVCYRRFILVIVLLTSTLCCFAGEAEVTIKSSPSGCPVLRTERCPKDGKERKFPDGFIWGAASSSYQVEGAWNVDGKGESIWDRAVHSDPSKIADGSNGDTAANSYTFHKDDVRALKEIGLNYYRFSISWPRILPNGSHTIVNELGLQYYDKLINELLANGIQPMVTMFHWDLPQTLQDLGGILNPVIVDYFVEYARVLIEHFGDRVKMWNTFNEPNVFCDFGYGKMMSGIGSYLCNYHALLMNARVYRMYHENYNNDKIGKIGIVIQSTFYYPKDPNKPEDVEAANRMILFWMGQFSHPIFSKTGGYPKIVEETIRNNSIAEGLSAPRLPVIDEEQRNLIRGTSDYFFLNYYTSAYAEPANVTTARDFPKPSSANDANVFTTQDDKWPKSASFWLRSVPDGLRQLLNWIKKEYDNPPVIITENGWSDRGEIQDFGRELYLKEHLTALQNAILEDGCNVLGHVTWSLIDDFEWTVGYTERFGLYHVDFTSSNKTRTAKHSTKLLRKIIETGKIPSN